MPRPPSDDYASPQALRRRGLGVGSVEHGIRVGLDSDRPVPVVFQWAPFRGTRAAVKIHTLLDLRGNIPSFIHISDGKLHDVNALELMIPEPGAIYIMDRAYLDFDRLFLLHQAGAFFVARAKSNTDFRRVYSAPSDREEIICDQTVALSGFYSQQKYPHHLRRVRFKDIETGKTLIFLTNLFGPPAATICLRAIQSTLASRIVFQMDQTASSHIAVIRNLRERGEGLNMDSSINVRSGSHYQEATQSGCLSLHLFTGILDHSFQENPFK